MSGIDHPECAPRAIQSEMTTIHAEFSVPHAHALDELIDNSACAPFETVTDSYPLSPMQEGMLFHNLLAERTGVDVLQMVCLLHEDLNVDALKDAWQRVVARHAVLRTSFRWEGLEQPVQDVYRSVDLCFDRRDCRAVPAQEREHHLECYLREDRRRGFDLAKPPLIRLALLHFAEAEYALIWTCHHAILGGRAIRLVLQEVFDCYAALSTGQDLQLPLPRPYRDHIEWLRRQDPSRAEAHWRELLTGFTAPTAPGYLPSEANGLGRESCQGEPEFPKQYFRFSQEVTSALRTLAEQHQVTLNTIFQGAWALLLSRYSGEEDVVFGATRACRRSTVEGADAIIGLFINTLPVRVQATPDMLLLPWLSQLREQHIAVRDFEQTPLVQVQAWSDVPRGMPLFQSLVVFENYLMDTALRAQGGSWQNREFRVLGQTGYPLRVAAFAGPELVGNIQYDPRRFDAATVARMVGHLQTLLEEIAAQPERRLGDLPLLTAAEREQLLMEWNDTAAEYPSDRCIHELFEEQVARTPEALAVVCEGSQLSYAELNAKANQLAHHLRALAVGPEVVVGICVERSVEMVLGLLGVLKAGAAYVPLDPKLPPERLRCTLEDTRSPVLLTQQHLLAGLPALEAQTFCLDRDWQQIAACPSTNPSREARSENPVYVLFTSGSTGRPKGVAVEHRQLVNYVLSILERLDFPAGASCAYVSTFAADLGNTMLFPAMVAGGTLHVISAELASDPNGLAEYFRQHQIDCLKIVPSHLAALLTAARPADVLPRQRLVLGGEASSWELIEKIHALAPNCRIFNHYGPTETTVGVLTYAVTPGETAPGATTLPLGRPLGNTQLYLLDAQRQPVPVGVPGEVYIGGAQVARGYLNNPELTAEKFLPNPFEPEGRVYRTGDLARYLPDGNIEFLGRIDHQVKIRGFRIELGEIEATLIAHAAVREALVIVREDEAGDKRLVAYLVIDGQSEFSVSELRNFLKERLPEYMLPAAFVRLEALPLTSNGKVDRRALPVPELGPVVAKQTDAAARDDLERRLVAIWEEVLGTRPIGIHDNFFDLGGHSLIAVRLLARTEKAFGKKLRLSLLLQAPTVAQLADIMRHEGCAPAWSSLVAIQPHGTRPPLFCLHPAGGNVLSYSELARRLGTLQPLYGVQSVFLDETQPQYTRIEEMVAHYLQELRAFQPHGPYYLAGFSKGGLLAWEMARQLRSAGEEVALLALLDTHGPGYGAAEELTLWERVPLHARSLLSEREGGWSYLQRKLKRRWRQVAGIDAREAQAVPLELQRAEELNKEAAGRYQPQPYAGNVTLFRARQQPLGATDETLGWGKVVEGELEIHEVPGDHLSIVKEPAVQVLAEKLQACLERLLVFPAPSVPPGGDFGAHRNSHQSTDLCEPHHEPSNSSTLSPMAR